MNPNAKANLRPPIKPGEVRNPKGINGFSNSFREMLAKAATEDDFVVITQKAIELARAGNVDAIKFILEKTYPKIEKPIDIKMTVEDYRDYIIRKLTEGESQ